MAVEPGSVVSMQRPQWVRTLTTWLVDDIIDEKHGYPFDGSDDEIHDEIEAAVFSVLCRRYGHEIVDDQCGIPEHRYCVHCGRRETEI